MRPHRDPAERAHIREPRRTPDHHIYFQVPRDRQRSQAQARRIPLLLPHARNTIYPICVQHSFGPSNAAT